MGYGSTKKKGISKYKLITFSAIFMLIWLLLSSLADRSPIRTVSSIGQLFSPDPEPEINYGRNELLSSIRQRDRQIDSLHEVIKSFSVIKQNDKAMVMIDSDELNARSAPSISSKILFKLRDSTLVDILLFDSETYSIGGKSGNWCKIEFGGEQGWVWGNYLQKVDSR